MLIVQGVESVEISPAKAADALCQISGGRGKSGSWRLPLSTPLSNAHELGLFESYLVDTLVRGALRHNEPFRPQGGLSQAPCDAALFFRRYGGDRIRLISR